ncbi:putative methyltransferase DDB_G0268948 [Branchiostoma lanceolatum]|uniref:putative methyltransferase DDB_G0268948 n=1 Tax=Branchiostoma lanceolatum TaxID=7740 RepID=UPI003451E192
MSAHLFSEADHAELYQKYRPKWSAEFAERVVTFVKEKKSSPLLHAVDIGCGSGQSSEILAPHFQHVLGIDVSEPQIALATANNKLGNVKYRVGPAESIPVPDGSVDLVMCLEAVHWFDHEKFNAEVDRVLVPGGVLAVAGTIYEKFPQDELSRISHQFLREGPMKDCWHEKLVKYLCTEYRNLPMPYGGAVRDESMSIDVDLTIPQYIKLQSTISPYREFCRRNPGDKGALLQNLQKSLYEATGSTQPVEELKVHVILPIFLLMVRKPQV